MRPVLPLALLLLVGCAKNPVKACEEFFDANQTCSQEAYDTTATTDPFAFFGGDIDCESIYGKVDGSAAKAATEMFTCYTETLAEADCSTPEGFQAANDVFCDCPWAPTCG